MELGLRFAAFIIDVVLCISLAFALIAGLFHGVGMIASVLPADLQLSMVFSLFGLMLLLPAMFLVWPLIYFALPTAIWGRTPGRWICRLRVTRGEQEAAGFGRGLAREVLKLVGIWFTLGPIIAAFQIASGDHAWYDQLCGTTVESALSLSGTQRQFRTAFPERRRGL